MNHPINCNLDPIKNEIICYHPTTDAEGRLSKYLPYHRHNAYEIYLFLRGKINLYLEHSCYQLKKGDLLVICPSEMHRAVCLDNEPYERIGINVKRSVLERLSSTQTNLLKCFEQHPIGQNNLVHLSEEQIKYYTELTEHLMASLKSSEYGNDVLAESYLAQILVFVNHVYQNSSPSTQSIMPEVVRNTMTYVKEHLNEKITLEQLSKIFYLNGTYISSQFKKHTGLSLRSYILDQRIALAKILLSGGANVSEACYRSGFSDYANFIRSFTKYAGVSPGKFRK